MERENRIGNFVKRNRLNFAARSVAAVSIAAAGIWDVEKSGSFDPLASSIDSAKHLVLKTPHKVYEQLIDKLPEVEKAEAAPPPPTVVYPSGNPGVPGTNCDPEEIDFTPHSETLYVGQSLTFRVDACLNPDTGLEVRLVEEDRAFDETLGKITVTSEFYSAGITFYLDCEAGGIFPNKLVGSSGHSQDVGGGADLAIETDYVGNGFEIVNSYDNVGAETGAAQISCLDPCPSGSGSGAGVGISEACPVGGIAELTDLSDSPQNMDSEKDKDNTTPIAAGVAAAAAAVTAAGAVLYINRRRHSS